MWAFLSKTVLKEQLLDFFAKQTDFSKRLTSWKANLKFENAIEGKTLKGFVQMLKESMGIDNVYVWHALGGYWGGISTDVTDDLPIALSSASASESNPDAVSAAARLFSLPLSLPQLDGIVYTTQATAANPSSPSTPSLTSTSEVGRHAGVVTPHTHSAPSSTSTAVTVPASTFIHNPASAFEDTSAVRVTFSRPTPHLLQVEPALAW